MSKSEEATRIFISADMEGICGVVGSDQTATAGAGYEGARKLMTLEVNAAIKGAFAGGAAEVVVNDAHGRMCNIIPDELDKRAFLISGSPKKLGMMEGIDGLFWGAFFIGYHARAGGTGLLEHTYYGRVVSNLKLNGQDSGELALNAAVAGHFGVPVLLVTGDSAVAAEASALLPGVRTVVVKEPLGRYAAKGIHPEQARELVAEAATRALEPAGRPHPFRPKTPTLIELEFRDSGMADMAEAIPGSRRTGARCASFVAGNPAEAMAVVRAMVNLAATTLEISREG